MKRFEIKWCRANASVLCCITLVCSMCLTGCVGTGTQAQTPDTGSASVERTTDQPVSSLTTEDQSADSPTGSDQTVNDSAAANQTTDSTISVDQSANAATTATNQTADNISLQQAKEVVLEYAKNTDGLTADDITFVKEEPDYDDGVAMYEIEFVTDTHKYEFEVRAEDSMIIKTSVESIEQLQHTLAETLTTDEVKSIALNAAELTAEQAAFTKVELDYDPADGATEYEIEFYADGTEYEITVDAITGKVLEMETERR